MKKQLLVLLLLCSKTILAQKVDLDKFNFKASYLQLPTNPFPEEYTTFSTRFIANGINLNDAGYTNGESDLASIYFKIGGFKRVNTGGHFTIKVQIDGYDLGKPESIKKETKSKDKEGKEVITLSYTMTFKYLVPMMYTITDLNGKILKDGPIAEGAISKTYESASYSTLPALEKYWTENSESVKKGLLGGFISEKLSLFQGRLDYEIGYIPRTVNDILWSMDSPKHPENDAFKKACEDTKTAMAEMTSAVPLNLSKMKPILIYFDSVLVKYNKDEKPERKLRYGAWFNMATIYYWLEDCENSIRCSQGLITNDYDKSDGKNLKSAAEKMKGLLANAKNKTFHYARDVSNAIAPAMSEFQNQEEEVRKQSLKDKAIQEATAREVATSQKQSSSSGMIDMDKSLKEIGGLINRIAKKQGNKTKTNNITFDLPLTDLIISMNESLANYQLIMKSLSVSQCSNNSTMEMLGQFDKFKKIYNDQKGKLDKASASKMKSLINSYETFMEKETMASYLMPSNPERMQSIMANAINLLKEQTGASLDLLLNDDSEKASVLMSLSDLQKTLNYATYGLYSEEKCNNQAYELAQRSFNKLKELETTIAITPEMKSEFNKLIMLYAPLLKSEKNTVRENINTQLIEKINKNEYPAFILALLQSK